MRSVIKTCRNLMVTQGHWLHYQINVLCKRRKDRLQLQGITYYPEYEQEVRLKAIHVVTTCGDNRDEAAYQA